MEPQILLFGAGKSATVLIDYLLAHTDEDGFTLVVADLSKTAVEEKLKGHPKGTGVSFNISNDKQRNELIAAATIVISLMPPTLHHLIAKDCLRLGKHLITASYVDDAMKSLADEAAGKGLLFLCEMGLDPGIDHMSAKKMIDDIHAEGGKILSFISHCGGLVAPVSDDNPWHYKISWNPRNVVNAGKAGAIYLQDGELKELTHAELFSEKRFVSIPDGQPLCWYPNRDSLSYRGSYGLGECHTFIRTTLRHPDFMYGWKNLIELKLTDDNVTYDTSGKNLGECMWAHLKRNGFDEWLEKRLSTSVSATNALLAELVRLTELEKQATEKGIPLSEEVMLVDPSGDLQNIDIDELKIQAATTLSDKMHEAGITLNQLFFLGLNGEPIALDRSSATPADLLLVALEKKLALQPSDRDLVVMLHEIEYERDGKKQKITATLYLEGKNDRTTAMATTVGLPLGIAARKILDKSFTMKGVQIPILPEIYLPVLEELEKLGIVFKEHLTLIS